MAGEKKTETTEQFWRAFRAATAASGGDYDVVSFADNPVLATELAELVVGGRKRATAGLLRQFAPEGEPLPVIGGHVVLVDGEGVPRAIWRTSELRLGPLASVDEAFAWDEGEGDRTRDGWLDAHRAFFGRMAKRDGFPMHDNIETVFERFRVVWPPEVADG
ncbi:MAG: ASCH domain-containing protein [Proteobacteria bacterium]|nr:ASCH domain-containing protein [Pseudomonadota bacterium]